MKAIVFDMESASGYALFRIPETTKDEVSFLIMPKTVILGMMGAVLGLDRTTEMRRLYPQFSKDVLYGICICRSSQTVPIMLVKPLPPDDSYKQGTDFRFNQLLLEDPHFRIMLAVNERSSTYPLFEKFIQRMLNGEAAYIPTMGQKKDPAIIRKVQEVSISKHFGKFETSCVIPNKDQYRILNSKLIEDAFTQNIPVAQNDQWLNTKSLSLVCRHFEEGEQRFVCEGEHYRTKGEKESWVLF